MKRFFSFLATLCVASVALAQNQNTTITRGNFLPRPVYATQSALSYFVDASTGNDSNNCTSVSTPCLTIQGAVNRVPKILRHVVTITVAAGTYAGGAYLEDFHFESGFTPSTGAYLQISGTLINATPATGTATGTATAGSAGSFGTTTWGTLTDSGQSWTVNDLRGKLIEITAGTGSGQVRAIDSNTATAITVAGTWTAPVAGSTYAIRDWGTTINAALTRPPSFATAAAANSGGFIVGESVVAMGGARNLVITNFKFSAITTGIIIPGNGGVTVVNNNFSGTTLFGINAIGNAMVIAQYNVATPGAGSTFFIHQASMPVGTNVVGNVVVGGLSFARFTDIQGLFFDGNSARSMTGTIFRYNNAIAGQISVIGSIFDTTSGGFCVERNSTTLVQAGVMSVSGSTMSNCSSGGIQVSGAGYIHVGSVVGTGNGTYGLLALNGGTIQFATTTTITGTNDIGLDGVTYSYATVRALSPKSVTDLTTLSRIWEP